MSHSNKITICSAISLTDIGKQSGQRWERIDYPDIHWFRRGRLCAECFKAFVTAEIDEKYLNELIKLRKQISSLHKAAEEYTKCSKETSDCLKIMDGIFNDLIPDMNE